MAKQAGGNSEKASGGSGRSGQGDVFDLERIRDLISLMDECGLSEVDLKQSDQQIRLVRGGAAAPAPIPSASAAPPVVGAATPAPASTPAADAAHITTISAPMVGTFYSKPNPKSDDFVKVGSKVSSETVICIIEAMKVFNEIPAELSGTVVEVLVSNEEAVDFGRPLFKVDTRG